MSARGAASVPTVSKHASSRERRSPLLAEASTVAPFPGGTTFRLHFPSGRNALVRLSALTRLDVAEETARLIWETSADGVTYRCKSSAEGACRAMLRFGEFLDAEGVSHVTRLAHVRTSDIDAFETWMFDRKPDSESGAAYAYLSDLVRLLGRAVDVGVASPSIATRCAYVSIAHARPATQLRDAYDEFTMRGIREAARSDVLKIAERLRAGRRLADSEWSVNRDALRTPEGILRTLYSSGLRGSAHYREICVGLRRQRLTGSEVVDLAYLGIPDLVPFLVLLMDDTGLPPECVHELRADCLVDRRPADGWTTMHYVKRRRAKDDRIYRHQVRTSREFAAGWVVELLLELTANARRDLGLAPDEGPLFLARWGGKVGSTRAHLPAVAAWLKRNPIAVDDKGGTLDKLVLSRIRKTSKAHDFVATGGNLRRIGKDHSVGTFVGRYAPVPALRERYEATATEGIQAALDAAVTPRVLDAAAETLLSTDPVGVATSLAITERQARDVASGAADAWVAGCLGVDVASHVGTPGFPCGAPVWGCLDCQNAVFTSSRLPHLLRLLDHVTAQRMRMNLADWRHAFGFAYARVIQIVDRFPPALVRAALDEIAADDTLDWTIAQLTHGGVA